MDPPEHTPIRKTGQRGFTRPRVAALEPRIEELAVELVEGFAGEGACDLMQAFCLELTTRTLTAMLDLPERDHAMFRGLRFDHFLVMDSGRHPMPEAMRDEVWERYATAHERLRELADERAADPGDDVISAMSSARDRDGERVMSREQVALHVCELAAAGTDTTAQLIANAVVFLSAHPDQLAEAIEDPSLWERRRRGDAAPPRIGDLRPALTERRRRDRGRHHPGRRGRLALAGERVQRPRALRRAGALGHPPREARRPPRLRQGPPLLPRRADRARGGAHRPACALRAPPGPAHRHAVAAGLRADRDPSDAPDAAGALGGGLIRPPRRRARGTPGSPRCRSGTSAPGRTCRRARGRARRPARRSARPTG